MRRALAALCLLLIVACSDSDDDYDPTYTSAPCEGTYGSVYSQCSERALSQDCAGAFGFGLLICIGRVCRPEAQQAVWQCCQMAYTTQGEVEACFAANAPA